MTLATNNAPMEGIPYFSPKHLISPGTPLEPDASTPTLFRPLRIRGATLKNRIVVSPMCQYSAAPSGPQIGALTPYHVMSLGQYALKGAGLVFIEATGVQPNGRITPNCPGLWDDSQIESFKAVADMIHSHDALCGIQLAHAGRKSSTTAPWIAAHNGRTSMRAIKEHHGWPEDVVSASGGEEFTWDGKRSDDPSGGFFAPRALTREEIKQMVQDWASAARRAVAAGIDVIEIHGAHGYLITQFLSPISNRRTDEYGGSFENRTRLLVEIITAIREVIPDQMPLLLRVSTTEWMDETEIGQKLGTWGVDDSIRLAKVVSDLGVDLLDCSSGGSHFQQRVHMLNSKDYQVKIGAQIRKELKAAGTPLLIGAVGLITQAEQARDIVGAETGEEAETAKQMTDASGGKEPMADVILVARQFMREPEWALKIAAQLGVKIAWPSQFTRVKL